MRVDFSDVFYGTIESGSITVDEVIKGFFTFGPKWIKPLFELRHKMVKPLGLKTNSHETFALNFPLKSGEKIGFFDILEVKENEVILGETDSHLDFTVSIRVEDKTQIAIETFVQFNNVLGRVYFQLIKPFHKLIVIRMIKDIVDRRR